MAICDLLQFKALFVCKVRGHFPMRFHHDFMDAPAGVSAYLFQLRCRLIDDRRNFGDLFGRQIELPAKLFLHSNAYQFRVVKFKENMPSVQSSKENAGNSPGDEHEDKAANQFPLQHAVHSKLILDRRIRDSEFIREGVAELFPVLSGFANRCNRRYDDDGRRQQCDAPKKRRQAVRLNRTRAPERDHPRIESKRHRNRNFFTRLCRRSQQPIDFLIFHSFSFAEILAS